MGSQRAYAYGYAIAHGYPLDQVDSMSQEARTVFLALAELNADKQEHMMYRAFKRALVEINKELFGGGA